MSRYEREVEDRLIKKGFLVLKNGYPDLMAFRRKKGKIVDFIFVEVKGRGDVLKLHQQKTHDILKELGFAVVVDYEEDPRKYWRQAQQKHRLKNFVPSSKTISKIVRILPEMTDPNRRKASARYAVKWAEDNLPTLTSKQYQVLMSSKTMSNEEIAKKFNISIQTVKNHLSNSYVKIRIFNELEKNRDKT
jgi:DNA-binding CsgD family transcriptional regulator